MQALLCNYSEYSIRSSFNASAMRNQALTSQPPRLLALNFGLSRKLGTMTHWCSDGPLGQDRPNVDDTPAGGESLQISDWDCCVAECYRVLQSVTVLQIPDWDCWFCGFEDATSSRARRIPDSSLCVHHKQTATSLLFSPPGLGTTFKVPNRSPQNDNISDDVFALNVIFTLGYISFFHQFLLSSLYMHWVKTAWAVKGGKGQYQVQLKASSLGFYTIMT